MYSHLLEEISRAIGARLLLKFTYKGKTYLVEPYLVGKNQLDTDCLRAWKIETSEIPAKKTCWCSFAFNEISNLKILNKRFSNNRLGYDPYDSSMKHIYYRM